MSVSLTQVGDLVFQYAFPLSFVGSVFLCTTQFFGIQIETIMNQTVSQWLYVLVGVSGLISLSTWFNYPIPVITDGLYQKKSVKLSGP
jgi:hypothetical protein